MAKKEENFEHYFAQMVKHLKDLYLSFYLIYLYLKLMKKDQALNIFSKNLSIKNVTFSAPPKSF